MYHSDDDDGDDGGGGGDGGGGYIAIDGDNHIIAVSVQL